MYFDDDFTDIDQDFTESESDRAENVELKDEFGAAERAGIGTGKVIDKSKMAGVEKAAITPLENFIVNIDAISRSVNDITNDIPQKDIDFMINKAETIKNIHYINPTAYVLGYVATGGGVELTKPNFNMVITNILPKIDKGAIVPADIVRYGRFWELLK